MALLSGMEGSRCYRGSHPPWHLLRTAPRKLPRIAARSECWRESFENSRDRWKEKYQSLQKRSKALLTDVRDLRRSRDRWRAKAEALEQEVNALHAQLKQRVESSPRAEPTLSQRCEPRLRPGPHAAINSVRCRSA